MIAAVAVFCWSDRLRARRMQGGLSRPLVQSVGVALLSTLLYGYNNGNMNTPALSIRTAIGIPSVALTPEGVSVPIPSNDTLWGAPATSRV